MKLDGSWVGKRSVTNSLEAPEVLLESDSYQKTFGFEMEWNFNRLIINKFLGLNVK